MAESIKIPVAAPPTIELLHELLHSGIERTLHEADEKEVLEPPYGRKMANPLPKTDDDGGGLDDDDPWADVEDDEEDEDDGEEEEEEEEPKFEYTYGFNPLLFLGEFLKTNTPKAVRQRAIERQKELEIQAKQAEVARVQQETFEFLSTKVRHYLTRIPLHERLYSSHLFMLPRYPGLYAAVRDCSRSYLL